MFGSKFWCREATVQKANPGIYADVAALIHKYQPLGINQFVMAYQEREYSHGDLCAWGWCVGAVV